MRCLEITVAFAVLATATWAFLTTLALPFWFERHGKIYRHHLPGTILVNGATYEPIDSELRSSDCWDGDVVPGPFVDLTPAGTVPVVGGPPATIMGGKAGLYVKLGPRCMARIRPVGPAG